MTERSTLLTLGILLTAIRCAGIMVFAALFGVLGVGMSGLLLFHPEPDSLLPFFPIALGAGLLIVLGVLIYYAVVLVACVGTWRGSRTWTWILVVFSALGLVHSGPLGLTINGITIAGCLQALGDRSRLTREPGI